MAPRVGDDDLLSRLMVGDLGVNGTFYHKECYTNLYNIYTKVCKESEKAGIDIEQYKDAAYDKVIAYIYEMQKDTPWSGFILQDLEFMYLEYLSQYGIQLESHVTRFGNNLTQRAPNLDPRDAKGCEQQTARFRIKLLYRYSLSVPPNVFGLDTTP